MGGGGDEGGGGYGGSMGGGGAGPPPAMPVVQGQVVQGTVVQPARSEGLIVTTACAVQAGYGGGPAEYANYGPRDSAADYGAPPPSSFRRPKSSLGPMVAAFVLGMAVVEA